MRARDLFERAARANADARAAQAIRLCDVALNASPDRDLEADLWLERATALAATRRWSEAEAACRKSLRAGETGRGLALLGRAHFEQQRSVEALAALARARTLGAESSPAWRALAEIDVLARAGEHTRALEAISVELGFRPENAALWRARGESCAALGCSNDAVHAFRRAVALDPGSAAAKYALGTMLLRIGELGEGFRYAEHRQGPAGSAARFGVRPWTGEAIDGKHVLVMSEQGYGDIIQFSRYVVRLRERCGSTTFLAPSRLVRLLSSNPNMGHIHGGHPGFGTADRQVLLLSLPHWLSLGRDELVVPSPYLFPEPERVERWRGALPPRPRIGLAWQGNPAYGGDRSRSMPCSVFAPLVARFSRAASFVSLQMNAGREQLRACSLGGVVLDLGATIDAGDDAFVDSLAILSLLELFVTTDTALAHLAGAAGVPTRLLLQHAADWRWGTHPSETLYYPTVRLFRQARGGDWAGVIARVNDQLGGHLSMRLACPIV